jgi:hypothetical protein
MMRRNLGAAEDAPPRVCSRLRPSFRRQRADLLSDEVWGRLCKIGHRFCAADSAPPRG